MKIFKTVNLVLLTLLSISAGIPKIMLMQDDLKFFQGAGFSESLIILFGLAHVAGGILLVFQKTRRLGAIIMAIIFCTSTIVIFMDGKTVLGFFSILPILMAGVVIQEKAKEKIVIFLVRFDNIFNCRSCDLT